MLRKWLLLGLVLAGVLLCPVVVWAADDVAALLERANAHLKGQKYSEAEELYEQILATVPADSNEALTAGRQLLRVYIATEKQAKADAAFESLIVDCATHEDLPEAIWRIGRAYLTAGKHDKAVQIHQYNVEHHASHKQAMWSQVGIFRSCFRRGDNAGADAAVDTLLRVFAGQPTLPKEIHQIAYRYDNKANREDKALELWRYNVAHFPNDEYAMRSQVRIVFSHIKDWDDASADAAVERLVSVFSEQPALPEQIRRVAERCEKARMVEEALEMHAYNVKNFPESPEAMASQLEIIDHYLEGGNPSVAASETDKLLRVFSQQKGLAGKVYEVAGRLGEAGNVDDAIRLYEYNVDNFAEDANSLLSQVEIAYANIERKDEAGIDAAVEKLVTAFAGREGLTSQW